MFNNRESVDPAGGPGELGAFGVFYKGNFQDAVRVLKARYPTFDSKWAEELVQDAMCSMFISLGDKFNEMADGKRRSYLFKTVRNKAIDHIEHSARDRELRDRTTDAGRNGEHSFEDVQIEDLFSRLPDDLREVAAYKWLSELTVEEVARVTGLSERTVSKRLAVARRKLEAWILIDGFRTSDVCRAVIAGQGEGRKHEPLPL